MDNLNIEEINNDYLIELEDAIVDLDDKFIALFEKVNFILHLNKTICEYLISKDLKFEDILEKFNKDMDKKGKSS